MLKSLFVKYFLVHVTSRNRVFARCLAIAEALIDGRISTFTCFIKMFPNCQSKPSWLLSTSFLFKEKPMQRLFSAVMSVFLFVFITFNLCSASALAQDNSDFSTSQEKPTLESIEDELKTIELLLLSNQGDQAEPDEITEMPEAELMQQESGVIEAVNVGSLNAFKARIDSWPGLPNFSGNEVTRLLYNRCRGNGIQNTVPPSRVWNNIAPTLAVLQRLRTDLGTPINLTSVYRSPDYNGCVGGVANSFHSLRNDSKSMTAIDFYANSGNPKAWTSKLRSYRGQTFTNPATGGNFIFRGGIGTYATFTHVDTRDYCANFGPRDFGVGSGCGKF